jgi:chromosome segregation ATPase
MSANISTLPAGWAEFLEEIKTRLDDAVAAADARIEQVGATESPPQDRRQEIARLEESLQGLSTRLQGAERLVEEVDQVLQAGQEVLQRHTASCGSVRQKLVDWAGRAIG